MICRCLELYQDEVGKRDKSSLKEAAAYVPHAVNQLSFHKGFSPQQWVFGKVMTHVHGLSGELFNPGQGALDEQGVFAEVQQRRAAAAKAFTLQLTATRSFDVPSLRSSRSRRRAWRWANSAGIGAMLELAFFDRPDGVVQREWSRLRTMETPEFYGCVMAPRWCVALLSR